jgi:hypothetical protein
MAPSGNSPEGNGNWVRAYGLALYGERVTFTGAYAAVTVVRNNDDSFTADIRRPGGGADVRTYARMSAAAVAAACASIAAHSPGSPECRSGRGRLCGHVTVASLPGGAR